jgi:hypothetical protein
MSAVKFMEQDPFMTQSPARSAALPPFPAQPVSGCHTIVQQTYDTMRDAYGRVELLVLEASASARQNASLAAFVDDNSHTLAHLDFCAFCVADAAPGARTIHARTHGCVKSLCDTDPELFSGLLGVSVVILDGLDAAIDAEPNRIGKLLSWCTSNLALTVVLTSNATAIVRLKLDHVRAAIDRMMLSHLVHTDECKSIATRLLQRVSKGGLL